MARHQRDHCPGVVMDEEEHEAEEDSGDHENTIPNEEQVRGLHCRNTTPYFCIPKNNTILV